jgi:hypothetical protein
VAADATISSQQGNLFSLELKFNFQFQSSTSIALIYAEMSLVTDSPVHSSSSDDLAAYLDASLDSGSSEEAEDANDDLETQRCGFFFFNTIGLFLLLGSLSMR